MSRDWQEDKRYIQELNNWELDPDDEDLFKIATYWLQYAEKWRVPYEVTCKLLDRQMERADAAEAREQKLREAIQTAIEMKKLNPEQMATDQKGLYDAAMWFLSGIMDSLYPKEGQIK
jgi:hypothetical protein